MTVHFGAKVTSAEQYDKAVRDEKGGANVFGSRVRSSIPESGPTNIAKRQSEFGPLTIEGAHGSDTKGKPNESLAIDEIRNLLAENPTFFDSLYENELARAEGARPDALGIFYEVERGIKGQMRQDVMDEIRGLLDEKGVAGRMAVNDAKARRDASDEMQQRNKENALLIDADRIKSLKERAENLKIVQDHDKRGVTGMQATSFDTAQQANAKNDHEGEGDGKAQSATGKVPTKPEGDTNVETQQPGARLGVPKGAEGEESKAGETAEASKTTSKRASAKKSSRSKK